MVRITDIMRTITLRNTAVLVSVLLISAGVSSCVIDYGENDNSSRRMSSSAMQLFDRYAAAPLEYMKTALLLDKYLSLSEEEKSSPEYEFIRNSYTVEGDVHTLFDCSFTIKGGSVWDKGAIWGSDMGMTIRRAEADSTWNLTITGDKLSDCQMEARMVSPMTVSEVGFKVTASGDYTSQNLKAHFSMEDFSYKWKRKVEYTHVLMSPYYIGTFDVLFYDGTVQKDWAKLMFFDSPYPEYDSSRGNPNFYRE